MERSILGIDVSKEELVVVLINNMNDKRKLNRFSNNKVGYKQLDRWVKAQVNGNKVIACAEATGRYCEGIASFLYLKDYDVSIVNPFCIKSYARSKLSRHKTDEIDANIIADYARVNDLKLYQPKSDIEKEISCLYRCMNKLKAMKIQAINYIEYEDYLPDSVVKLWKNTIRQLEQKISDVEKQLEGIIESNSIMKERYKNLQTIPGVGKLTAMAILSEVPDISKFHNARQLAAYAGVTPKHNTSGISVRGKPRISKIGSSNLRKAIYFPAITAKKHNPIIKEFCEKLKKKGKHKMSIVCAAQRKLLHIIFGILKNNRKFEVGESALSAS